MKVKAKTGKEYFYDYTPILIKRNTHDILRKMAQKNNMPLTKFLDVMVERYDD